MKVLVVSDNHGEKQLIQKLPKEVNADLNIHLGDSEFKHNDDILSVYECVRGNTDFDMNFKEEGIYEGLIFYTHGHLYHVKKNREILASKAKALGAKYALYGHTHTAKVEKINGVYCINPGSIHYSRSDYPESYAVLDTDDNTVSFYSRKTECLDTFNLNNM